jgi:hypothetical protein
MASGKLFSSLKSLYTFLQLQDIVSKWARVANISFYSFISSLPSPDLNTFFFVGGRVSTSNLYSEHHSSTCKIMVSMLALNKKLTKIAEYYVYI